MRPIRSEAWKGFSPPRSTKSFSSAPCCRRITAKSNLSASRHTDSGDLLLFLRPLGSALCCKRFFTNSSRFLTSDANTKSSGTQEASHSAAQPSKKSKDTFWTARLATESMINFCTKHLRTGHSALKISNAVEEKNIEYVTYQTRETGFYHVFKQQEEMTIEDVIIAVEVAN